MVRFRYCQVIDLIPCSSFRRWQGSSICAGKMAKYWHFGFSYLTGLMLVLHQCIYFSSSGLVQMSIRSISPNRGEWSRKWSNRDEGGGFCPHLKFGSKSDPPNGDNLFWFPSTRIISAAAHLDEVGDQKIITSGCRWRWLSCCDEMSVRGWGYR